ncbi:MAG: hypothetical protein ACJ72E_09135 [Marmoricola sp.]
MATGRLLRVLPWSLAALALLLTATAETTAISTGIPNSLSGDAFIWAITIVFGATGGLVASRHPENPIGWLFLAASVAAGLGSLAGTYADLYADKQVGPELLARISAQYGELSWMPFIILPSTFLLALFPDGHLVSPRWRPVAWCAGVGMVVGFLDEGMKPGPISDHPELTNPFGVHSPLIDPIDGLSLLLIGIGIIGSAASLVVRFRRSRGAEREQMKWLALAGTVVAVTIVVVMPIYDTLGSALSNDLMMLAVIGLPLAAGVAILRYRLYDIDLVINRTLVYLTLTAILAGVYLGSVLLLQLALESITQGSGLAVAVSTLATAAVVRPARARIQSVVDRRFFRRRYDAARTLAEFGARLRDQVDLDALQRDLRTVVAETMQPAHLSLWTTPGRGPSR